MSDKNKMSRDIVISDVESMSLSAGVLFFSVAGGCSSMGLRESQTIKIKLLGDMLQIEVSDERRAQTQEGGV